MQYLIFSTLLLSINSLSAGQGVTTPQEPKKIPPVQQPVPVPVPSQPPQPTVVEHTHTVIVPVERPPVVQDPEYTHYQTQAEQLQREKVLRDKMLLENAPPDSALQDRMLQHDQTEQDKILQDRIQQKNLIQAQRQNKLHQSPQ